MLIGYRHLVIKIAIIVASTLIIYGKDLSLIFGNSLILSSANIGNYILALPFMIVFALFKKRDVLRVMIALKDDTRWISIPLGISLSTVAIVLFIYGSSTLYALDYHIYSMSIFITGATLLFFNIKTLRHIFFAIIMLLFLQPPSGEIVQIVSADLSWTSAVLLDGFLHISGIKANLDATYGAPAFNLENANGVKNTFVIGEPSSGVYSTIGMTIFGLFISYIATGKFWRRLLVVGLSFPLFYVLNVLRIGIIMLLWYGFGNDVSESFHLVGGIVMVSTGSFLLLVVGEKLFGIRLFPKKQKTKVRCIGCHSSAISNENFCLLCGGMLKELKVKFGRRSAGCALLMVLLAAIIVSSQTQTQAIASKASNDLENLDIPSVKGSETTPYMLPNVNGMEPKFAYRDTNIEKVLRHDLALAFTYDQQSALSRSPSVLYVGIQIGPGRHNWEESIVIYPSQFGRPTAKVLEYKDVSISDNQIGRFFVYQRPNSNLTEAVLYWNDRLPFKFGSNLENRNVQIVLWNYASNFVRNGVIANATDLSGLEQYLIQFAKPIVSKWKDEKNNSVSPSLLDTIIGQNYLTIIAISFIPSIVVIPLQFIKLIKSRIMYKALLKRLKIKDELVVVEAAQKCKGLATGMAIAQSYKLLGGSEMHTDLHRFADLLKSSREAGILRNDITINNNEPCMIWKTKLHGVL